MADKNIGLLPSATELYDDSLLVVEQQGVAVKLSGAQFKQFAQHSVNFHIETAKNYAEDAWNSAKDAQESAKEASNSAIVAKQYSGNPPIISMGTWWIWNAASQKHENTELPAQGPIGPKGNTGSSIKSIDRVSGSGSPGSIDTYTVTLTDNTIGGSFNVYNGRDGFGLGEHLTVFLSASGWGATYMQTVENEFFLENGYTYIVEAKNFVDADDITIDGQMTFRCTQPILEDITVDILRIEVIEHGKSI